MTLKYANFDLVDLLWKRSTRKSSRQTYLKEYQLESNLMPSAIDQKRPRRSSHDVLWKSLIKNWPWWTAFQINRTRRLWITLLPSCAFFGPLLHLPVSFTLWLGFFLYLLISLYFPIIRVWPRVGLFRIFINNDFIASSSCSFLFL